MKLSHRKISRGRSIGLDLTSMIDVVFLLLIFFLLNVSFQLTERNLDAAIQDQSRTGRRNQFEPVIVEFERQGGGHVYKLGARRMASAAQLTEVLSKFSNKLDGAFVRVADDTPFAMVAAAVQACHDAGFLAVSYVADSKSSTVPSVP